MASAFSETRLEVLSIDDLEREIRAAGPLFAIVDAARDPMILEQLRDGGCEYRSLYAGRRGEQLASVAPYLAKIVPRSNLQQAILGGWGQSWGVLLSADIPFAEVRRHLRRFLVVETEDARPLSFRFYDPRVLGPFLRSATAAEARRFFGPITSFLFEERQRALVRFKRVGAAAPTAAAPHELPRIRDAQMAAFSRELTARFIDRIAEQHGAALQAVTPPRTGLLAVIRAGITRADQHNITGTDEVERYLVILAALGPAFDARVPWARAILDRDDLGGPQKLSRLERGLRQRRS